MKLSLNVWTFFYNAASVLPVEPASLKAFHAFSLLAPHWLASCPFPPNFETAKSHDQKNGQRALEELAIEGIRTPPIR